MPVPLHVRAPGKPLLHVLVAWNLVCDLALRVCDIVWLFVMVRVLSDLLSSFSCLRRRAGQVTGQPLWGTSFLMVYFLGVALWGRFPWWGDHRPLGAKVLHNDSPEGRGGPWAPPPRVFFSKLWCSLLVSCLILQTRVFFSKLWCSLLVSCLILQTVCFLKGLLLWECLLGYLSPSSFRPLSVLGVRFHDVDGLFWTYFWRFSLVLAKCLVFPFFSVSISLSLSLFFSLSFAA